MGTRTKPYGDPEIAGRLRLARAAAGFNSARSAAVAHRWPPSSVSSHERAERALGPSDLSRYAQAYRVEPTWIEHGVGDAPDGASEVPRPASDPRHHQPVREPWTQQTKDDAERWARIEERTRNHRMAFRLGVARRLAGFDTASEACLHFGFNRSTYGGHEYGYKGPLTKPSADVYAAAFGVPAGWLRLEGEPTGMPGPVIAAVEAAEANTHLTRSMRKGEDDYVLLAVGSARVFDVCKAFADPVRRGAPALVERLLQKAASGRRVARTRRLGEPPVHLPEMPLPELVRGGMPDAASYWTVPAGFVRDGGEGAVIVTVLTDDQPRIGLAAGDRIVIDGDPGLSTGALLLWSDGRLSVVEDAHPAPGVDGRSDEMILGRIVATIRNGSAGLA